MVAGYVVVCCGSLEYIGQVARPTVHHLISSHLKAWTVSNGTGCTGLSAKEAVRILLLVNK